MNVSVLKRELVEKINDLHEIGIIKDIHKYLDFGLEESAYQLNAQQRKRIAEAQKDVLEGKVLNEDQANYAIEKCLKEK